MPAKAVEDPNKPLMAALFSFILPGAGQWFIQNQERAKMYFIGWLVADGLAIVVLIFTLGLCFPLYFVPMIYHLAAAADAYFEARGEEDKRLLKKYIK